jgi:2-polyprenyl-3-methyl-5-hydroxy-6-metoxy-1,4-benzoquinol methylase
MPDQVEYYNHFAELYKEDILACPQPELWTTDYREKGRVYKEMCERIKQQGSLIDRFFSDKFPVLDGGCGFGRQAIMLAKKGFAVTGFDNSEGFIEIAKELFERHNLTDRFLTGKIEDLQLNQFSQLILFDMLEHIKPSTRQIFFKKIYSLSLPGAKLIVSLPHVKKRFTSQLNNSVRRRITQHFSYFLKREEHPYPIPTQKNMNKLIKGFFAILKFEETADTNYYVLIKH